MEQSSTYSIPVTFMDLFNRRYLAKGLLPALPAAGDLVYLGQLGYEVASREWTLLSDGLVEVMVMLRPQLVADEQHSFRYPEEKESPTEPLAPVNTVANQADSEANVWTAEAWLYFVWAVMGHRIYCKIGYSTNPSSRFNQIMAGIPERPYQLHLLPCLNVEQAKLFESMFHNRLKEFKTKGKREWFSHPSANRFYKMVAGHTAEILSVFRTFGYETHLESIALNGKQPVSYDIDSLTANELE